MSAASRAFQRVLRERTVPLHIRRHVRWRLSKQSITSMIPPPPGGMKPVIDERAAELLRAFEAVGVDAFLVEELGHRVVIGVADEQRSEALSVMPTVLPNWDLSTQRTSMVLDPDWDGCGGAGIDISLWQLNDLGERERVGARGVDRIFASTDLVRVKLGRHEVMARPSYVPEPMRHRPRFPIDAVISWVDDSDEDWRSRMDTARRCTSVPPLSVEPARFRSRQELKYLLRSIERFAPFVQRVYVVTDCRLPEWLHQEDPALEVVNQTELLGGEPVFNSLAVEATLHNIEGLSEHYVYFNDDMFLARPVEPELFFNPAGNMLLTQGPRIRAGFPRPDENAFETAAKVARELVSEHFGWTPEYNSNHVPLPQRRSVAEAAEELFAEAITSTRRSTFRGPTNTTTATGLFHHVGAAMGLIGRSSLRWDYVDTGDRFAGSRYADLLASPQVDAFCCNDATGSIPDRTERSLTTFLEQYFPGPGRFESQ